MHKLVVLIPALDDWPAFEARWPEFLHLVEGMPGLRREATSHVEQFLFGGTPYVLVHELFFDTLAEMEEAMASSPGRAAGRLLQQMTGGRLALFYAEHKEDDMDHILKYRSQATTQGEDATA